MQLEDILLTLEEIMQNEWIHAAFYALGAMLLLKLVNNYIGRVIRTVVKSHKYESKKVEKQREDTLISILRTSSAVVIWSTAILLIMSNFGVNVAAFATGAGLIGAGLAFGAQSTIKDFLTGIFIIAENQYRVGDVVTLAGQSGVVESISIRVTRLRDLDGKLHIIPNGQIDQVTNMTFEFANVNVDVGISYSADIEKTIEVVNKVGQSLANDKDWKDMILEPIEFLRVNQFADSAVEIKCLGKVVPGMQWDVGGEFRKRLKAAFDKNNIEIPFPQRVMHMIDDAPAKTKK